MVTVLEKRLSIQQVNFCTEYVKTGSAIDAYLSAYNTESRATASVEANKLLNKPYIIKYIDNLMSPIIVDAQINKQQQIEFIKQRINICIKSNDESSIIKYIDMLNKIYGYYKEPSSTNDNNKTILSALSTDDIKTLLE